MSEADNVVYLDNVSRLDVPADRVLLGAQEAGLESVVVVGWDERGGFYFSSSLADAAETILLLELAKKKLLEIISP